MERMRTCAHNETIGPSEDRKSAIDLAIFREDPQRPRMFLRWVDGKADVADALTSHRPRLREPVIETSIPVTSPPTVT